MKLIILGSYSYPEKVTSTFLWGNLKQTMVSEGVSIEVYVPTPTRGINIETRKRYKKLKFEELYQGKSKTYRFSMFQEGKAH